MAKVNVYLNFDGNCETAFKFYQSVFKGEFQYIGRFKDMPPMEGIPPLTKEEGEKIMHVSLPISEETILMGSDVGGDWSPKFKLGNNFSVSINTGSKEEADHLFTGLSVGGQVTMPMQSTFWGDYFGSFTDKFEINWMVSFAEKPMK